MGCMQAATSDREDSSSADTRLFTADEAVSDPASPLAGRINRHTVYALIRAGKMPGIVRVGRKVWVTAAGLRAFIAGGGTPTLGGAK
jgi:hypothetical protein